MTKFKNHGLNAFGDSAGDSLTEHCTKWSGVGGAFPYGKLKRYPGEAGNASVGNRRLAKSMYGDGGEGGTTFKKGVNAFSRGGKGK